MPLQSILKMQYGRPLEATATILAEINDVNKIILNQFGISGLLQMSRTHQLYGATNRRKRHFIEILKKPSTQQHSGLQYAHAASVLGPSSG